MEKKLFWVFLLPAIISLFLLSVYPFIETIIMSLHNINIVEPYREVKFIGLQNFSKLLSDLRFMNSLKVSFTFTLTTTLLTFLIGMGLALFLKAYAKGKLLSMVSVLFAIPALSSRVAIAYIWKLMYEPSYGIINYFLNILGIGTVNWLSDPRTALPAIMIVDIWQWTPLISLMLLAALQAIPSEIYDACEVDGASGWQKFRYITFPLLSLLALPVILLKLVESFRIFDLMYCMTKGGPGITTENLDLYAYWIGISTGGEISYAACMSLIMLIITILLTTLILRLYEMGTKKWYK
jgi:multiple sugar transport system permease protein